MIFKVRLWLKAEKDVWFSVIRCGVLSSAITFTHTSTSSKVTQTYQIFIKYLSANMTRVQHAWFENE